MIAKHSIVVLHTNGFHRAKRSNVFNQSIYIVSLEIILYRK